MLTISHISKTFNPGTVNAKKALDDLSLTVRDGEFVTIIGANGAGKSTLFNAISGSFITDSGSILLDDLDVTLLPEYKRARQIGRLFQDPLRGSAPGMSIEENLALAAGRGGWLGHISRADREDFRDRLRPLGMGLEDRMQQPVGLLSGGQRQALTLMMATVNPPKLLLLDEHTAALDPASAEKVLAITRRIVEEEGLTCLMVTHNMQSALDLGSRTIMMDRGRIIFDVAGEQRAGLTITDLLEQFKRAAGKALDNDRMLLGVE
ncbi:MAG: ATP-binding cassette domain-containing protein [Oscillospiraceae bacterium]|nr:ATP-binding cassette domain-containing protein [Oscillospiraceae bacterium]